eukprot:scaffold14521_cov200-Alexandrium_tamarense.AAC.2
MVPSAVNRIVILYGIGGLSDVGRHAILAALEKPSVEHITVITSYPELLDEKNWECNCLPDSGHTNPFNDPAYAKRLEMVKINSWKNDHDLSKHFQSATVVSCLGNRQPGWKNAEIKKGWIAYEGNKQVIKAMEGAHVSRVVVISSIGLKGDDNAWPHFANKVMKILFKTFQRKARKDLEAMESLYKQSSLDYLLVRPVGIGEDVVPVGEYFLQEYGEEAVGGNMAKLDVARFMVDEALSPSLHKTSKVVGSKPGSPM